MPVILFAVLRRFKAGENAPNHRIDEVGFFEKSTTDLGKRIYTEVFARIYVIRVVSENTHVGGWHASRADARKALPGLVAVNASVPQNGATTTATLTDIVNTKQIARIATDEERVEIGLAHAGFIRKHVVGSKNKTASTAKSEAAAIPASSEVSKGLKR